MGATAASIALLMHYRYCKRAANLQNPAHLKKRAVFSELSGQLRQSETLGVKQLAISKAKVFPRVAADKYFASHMHEMNA